MNKFLLLFILILCLLISAFGRQPNNQKNGPIIVGILEDHNIFGSGDLEKFHVIRAVFKKTGANWYSLKDTFLNSDEKNRAPLHPIPEKIDWHVCFDGKEIGIVKSMRYRGKYINGISNTGLFMPDAEKNAPIVGQRGDYFRGWVDDPIYRPLVLNTSPYYQDPEVWKPYVGTDEDLGLLKAKLQKQFRLFDRTPAKAKITFLKSYQSQTNHAKILSIEVGNVDNVKTLPLDAATEEEHPRYSLTYFVDDGGIRYLFGSLTLIDAGDYDNDGRDEFIFKYQGYNYDGYLVYYNNCKQSAEFGWNYH